MAEAMLQRIGPPETEVDSLYAVVMFPDAEAAKEAIRHDVSIGVEEDWVDGYGNAYDGLTMHHLALTSAPVIPELGPWQFMGLSADGQHTYMKEVAFSGSFYHPGDGAVIGVSLEGLGAMATNHAKLTMNRTKVPVQLTHESDGKQLGNIAGLGLRKDSKKGNQQPAMAADLLASVINTPVFSTPASLVMLSRKGATMATNDHSLDDLIALAKDFGIEVPEQATRDRLMADLRKFAAVKVEASQQADVAAVPVVPATSPVSAAATTAAAAAAAVPVAASLSQTLPPVLIKTMANARAAEVAALIAQGRITPAMGKAATEQYATVDAVKLCLSQAGGTDPYDSFLKVANAAEAQGAAWQQSGRTKIDPTVAKANMAQHGGAPTESPIIAAGKSMGLIVEK